MGGRASGDWGGPAARAGVWNPWRGRQPLGKGGGNSGKRGSENHGGEGWGGPSVGRGAAKYPAARCRLPLRSLFQLESPQHAIKGQPLR